MLLHRMRLALALAAGTLVLPGRAVSQAATEHRHRLLRGTTVDVIGRAIGGVALSWVESGRETVSDSLGQFAFDSVPPGTVTIRLSCAGFVSLDVSVPVPDDHTARVPLLLTSLDESFERDVQTSVLFGLISDTEGKPLDAVELTVIATGQRTVTDSLGRYMIRRNDPTARLIRIRKIGFTPQQLEVRADVAGSSRADITLGKLAATLETQVVRADRKLLRMRPLFSRMERDTRNQFVTRNQIDFTRNGSTTDLLTRLRGVTLGYNSKGFAIPLLRGTCPLRVLLNGQELELDDFALNSIVLLRDIAGVEAYTSPGEVPTDFWFGFSGSGTSVGCGVIGIWTRLLDERAP